jgi:type I restriction enzyme R subunit
MTWKTANGKTQATSTQPQLEVLLQGLLNPVTLLDMIRHFIVFEASKHEDSKGIISIRTVKKMALITSTTRSMQQFFPLFVPQRECGLPSAEVALRQQGRNSKDLVNAQKTGDRKAGVVWHTQGSGKSLSMVFYTGKIVLALDNPTVVVITDRNDLMISYSVRFLLLHSYFVRHQTGQQPEELKEYLRVASGGVVFTTIQKFQPDDGSNIYELLSDRTNIVVIADEAHRSQYGFSAKEVDVKDSEGNVTGKRTVYGFAKYMRDALPNATYLGFTGTPIEKTDVNTPAVFGNYVDIYDISQAVEDGATVRIFYESRLAKLPSVMKADSLLKSLTMSLTKTN